jgi:SAM-dependent methyltransferase
MGKKASVPEVTPAGQVPPPGAASPGPQYSAYDAFARVYNRHWGPRAGEKNFSLLKEMLLPRLPANAQILDLCCGAGQLVQALAATGYRVTGLDGSEELLTLARQNAPGVEFVLADARSFSLPPDYDAAISVSDSLNHIMSLLELTLAFQHVYAVLRDGGLFFFDLNRGYKYATTWSGQFSIVEDDQVCVVRASYSPGDRVARFDATVFENLGGWRRADVALFQTWYAEAEVRPALESAGLGNVEVSYSNPTNEEESDKAYYLCKKQARS